MGKKTIESSIKKRYEAKKGDRLQKERGGGGEGRHEEDVTRWVTSDRRLLVERTHPL